MEFCPWLTLGSFSPPFPPSLSPPSQELQERVIIGRGQDYQEDGKKQWKLDDPLSNQTQGQHMEHARGTLIPSLT